VSAKVYQGLSFPQYAAIRAVNASLLKRVAGGSPLHGLEYLQSGGGEDTYSRMELRAVHALALEGEAAFRRGYAVWEGSRRGQAWLDFETQQIGAGRTIITSAERARVQARAAALLAHPVAGPMLRHEDARPEVTVVWTDEVTGLPCKARLDLWVDAEIGVTIADLKTWGSTDPLSVSREIAKQLVHLQLAHYAEAVEAVTGVKPTEAAVIVVEDKAPHDVGVFQLTMGGGLDIGRALWRRTMATWAEATRSGVYPGRIPEPYDIILPAWAEEDTDTEGDADGT
jgi:hypothetical protein